MRRSALWIILVCVGAAVVARAAVRSPSTRPADLYLHRSVNVAGDRYRYSLDIPAPYHAAAKRPLVVVIHGCNSTDDEQAAVSGYDAIAAEKNFLVLYPDVDAGDVRTGRCWKGFWRPADETRGHGDARAIAEMTRAVVGSWNVDASRIYVIGISSGAFEASMLGADYPDVYAAIGIHSDRKSVV